MLITKRAINYENKDEIKLNPKILLIIPAYNEADGIEDVIRKVNDYRKNYKYILDYIVINDGSTDNEEEILRKNDINHVELVNNLGIGGAVQTGYIYALENDYDIAVQFDGDGQHDIQSLPNDLDDLPLKDLLTLVQENPGLLRRPIMIDEKRLQVGFNEDEIRRFLPRDVRQLELRQAQLMAGL